MNMNSLTVATCRLESARQVTVLPDGHRCRTTHGHSFMVTVFAKLPEGWAPFPGDESPEMQRRLKHCAEPLNYSLLNNTIEQPTDENIARWIRDRLDIPGIDRIAVQSTINQGVDLDNDGNAQVWRRYSFQAAHQLPNVPEGHKCGRMHGHGFEVIIHANKDIGNRDLSVDYDLLDDLWAPLGLKLNYQCLNKIEGLSNPTSENIAAWVWTQLQPSLSDLSWVTVFETASCGANFDGANYRIWKEFTLDSAVRIKRAPDFSPQREIHGHTFTLRLHLLAPLDQVMGWTIDFGDVKAIFDPIFKSLDHHPIDEIEEIEDGDTGSIARWIYTHAKSKLPQLARVDLYETEGCGTVACADLNGPALPI